MFNLLTPSNLLWIIDLQDFNPSCKNAIGSGKGFAKPFTGKPNPVPFEQGGKVKVKFTLNMENLTVASFPDNEREKEIDRLTISWISDISEEEVLNMSGKWIGTKDFLTQRMTDLKKVGESSLTIEPVEEMKV